MIPAPPARPRRAPPRELAGVPFGRPRLRANAGWGAAARGAMLTRLACAPGRDLVNRPGESGDPSRRSGAEVCQVPTRIVLSYLTLWAQRSRAQAWLPGDARSQGVGGLRPAGRCCGLYIGPAFVTCLEICCSPSRGPVSGPAPSGCSEPRAGGLATQCERGRVRSAPAGTPNADLVRRGLLAGSSWPKRQIDQF